MSRIAATFEALKKQKKKALIPFVTAGDPTPALTVALMHSLVDGGADVLELGVPFSDPMADGPVIQRSSERALKQGVSLKDVIGFVREFRSTNTSTPVVLMGYANPVEAMGLERFADAAGAAGVDGVLVVDYPPGEAQRLVELLDAHGLDTIFLLSPTTTDARLEEVKRVGRGYLYYVSLRGVTGASHIDLADVAARVKRVQKASALPVGVGFGIRDPETAQAVAAFADAVVVGSRLVQEVESAKPGEVVERVKALMADFRRAMDAPGKKAHA
ncbi:MAG: tryptophan synthase subunit alpha [Burkholderiales bacterium]